MGDKLLVFGGQFGSEGKGAVLAHYAHQTNYSYTVRGGGPQAGHTFYTPQHGKVVVRQVPVGTFFGAIGYLGPGAVVDPEVLQAEMDRYNLHGRVYVHPNAFSVTPDDRAVEREMVEKGLIPGSTCEGTGNARARKALRMGKPTLLKGVAPIDPAYPWVDCSREVYNEMLDNWLGLAGKVLVEGCQGFGLSNSHGHWPFVTSGDVTPPSILAECGLPVIPDLWTLAVMRTYPIRVGGNSGPMGAEIAFEDLGVPAEVTTVTGRKRRVAMFDYEHLLQMDRVCNPDAIALTFVDYLDPELRSRPWTQVLNNNAVQLFLSNWVPYLRNKLTLFGTGPGMEDYSGPADVKGAIYS